MLSRRARRRSVSLQARTRRKAAARVTLSDGVCRRKKQDDETGARQTSYGNYAGTNRHHRQLMGAGRRKRTHESSATRQPAARRRKPFGAKIAAYIRTFDPNSTTGGPHQMTFDKGGPTLLSVLEGPPSRV